MRKTALLIMIIAVISKIMGLLRDVLLANYYGATYLTDSYIIAALIPSSIILFFGTAISSGFIPHYSAIFRNHDRHSADKFTSRILNLIVIISFFITLLVLIFTQEVVLIFASGFPEDVLELTVKYTRITVLSVIGTSYIHVFIGYLHYYGNFIIPAIITLLSNLFLIVSIYISSHGSFDILIYGYLLSTLIQVIFIVPFIIRLKFRYSASFRFRDSTVYTFGLSIMPILISVSVSDINKIIDKTLASRIIEGGVSILSYSEKISSIVFGIVVLSITTIIFPAFSNQVNDGKLNELKKTFSNGISFMLLLVLPITLYLIVYPTEVVTLLFGRGEFGENTLIFTSSTLLFYSIGLPFNSLIQLYNRVFFSFKDLKSPMFNSFIAILINVVLNLFFFFFTNFGVKGIALATSISSFISFIFLRIRIRKHIGKIDNKKLLENVFFICFASIISVVLSVILKRTFSLINLPFSLSSNLIFTISVIISFFAYLLLIYIMNIDNTRMYTKLLFKRNRNRKN